jgi:hypothetical protein
MKHKIILIAVGTITLIALVACDAGAPVLQPSATPTQAESTPPPSTDTRIFYQYTGGIAGFRKELVIGPNGKARLADKDVQVGRIELGKERYAQLIKQFEDARFFNLLDRYEKSDMVVDDDIYLTISFSQGDRTKSVTVAQLSGQEITPQPLKDLIAELDKIVSEVEASAPTPTP